ncbi:MAG: hypothetical protein R3Y07_04790 [Eubacteriales bacterium]
MSDHNQAIQVSAHKAAKEGRFDKALEIMDSLPANHKTWDTVFYRTYYRYGRSGIEKTSFAHIETLNKSVIATFATVLAQNIDPLETLICFQDVYDQIWDLSSRLQHFAHKEYLSKVKGKSISEECYQQYLTQYTDRLKKTLSLSENFINALGNLSGYTTINLDLLWDFYQNNDGLFCFLLAYDGDPIYEEKCVENRKIIQLKRPDYIPVTVPSPVKPTQISDDVLEPPKKKGFLGRFFQ